jgi:hypothetical protein
MHHPPPIPEIVTDMYVNPHGVLTRNQRTEGDVGLGVKLCNCNSSVFGDPSCLLKFSYYNQ